MPSLLVRSGSNWVPEKGIYVMQGGSWQRKMGYVYVNGQWVPLSAPIDGFIIYFEGYEAVSLTDDARNGYARRGPTALEMFASGNQYVGAFANFTTVNAIDITHYSQIRVRWRSAGENYSSIYSYLDLLRADGPAVVRRVQRTMRFDWQEYFMNISDLRGPYRIRVEARVLSPVESSTHLFVSQLYLV